MTITPPLAAGHKPVLPRFPLPTIPIDRRSAIGAEEFDREYQQGGGRPVIVTDALDGWAARDKWTFNFFRNHYGNDPVIVGDNLCNRSVEQPVRFGEYLTYCEMPSASPLSRIASPTPLYLFTFNPFDRHPELLNDFAPPYFEQNCYQELQGTMREWYVRHFSWLFIGPKGTLTPLHVDLFMTHAWLAQLRGRKHCLLTSPAERDLCPEGMVLTSPDPDSYPESFRRAHVYEGILEPGETLFVPAGWGHHVVSMSASITLSFNFVNKSNYMDHLLGICREMPRWVGIAKEPDFLSAVRAYCP